MEDGKLRYVVYEKEFQKEIKTRGEIILREIKGICLS